MGFAKSASRKNCEVYVTQYERNMNWNWNTICIITSLRTRTETVYFQSLHLKGAHYYRNNDILEIIGLVSKDVLVSTFQARVHGFFLTRDAFRNCPFHVSKVNGKWNGSCSRFRNVEFCFVISHTLNTMVYPIVSGLAAWSENCKCYSSLPLGAVVSLFWESV
jgi:hypothetical protein